MTSSGSDLPVDPVVGTVEVRLLRLPLIEALATGHGQAVPGRVRELTVVGLSAAAQAGLWGWGECAALSGSEYWFETASSSYEVLVAEANRFPGRTASELAVGGDPDRAGLDQFPMAAAAIEMAALDLALTAGGQPLAEWIGATRTLTAAGATVGLGPVEEVADRVQQLNEQGFRRVKLKIEPGHDLEPVTAIARRVALVPTASATGGNGRSRLELHVDANGSYRADETGLAALLALADQGVAVIEQPFAVDDAGAAGLATRLRSSNSPTLVLADESASSVADAIDLLTSGSVAGVVVKPGRLGGIAAARQVIQRAAEIGRPVSIGGMLESGLGRHVLAALTALGGVSVTGDVSPARRWLADDPWPDLDMVRDDGGLRIVVPTGPGIAPAPNREKLDRYTVERWTSSSATT